MQAPVDIVAARFARRSRPLEISERDDLETIDFLLQDWLMNPGAQKITPLDASMEDPRYEIPLPDLLVQMENYR